MPVATRRNTLPPIGRMTHRVTLARARDIVVDGDIRIVREGVVTVMAMIEERRESLFTREGAPVREPRERASHQITMHAIPDVDITAAAWVYQDASDRPSGARLFKVLDVSEMGAVAGPVPRYWKMSCRLTDRGDDVLSPTAARDAQAPLLAPTPRLPAGL